MVVLNFHYTAHTGKLFNLKDVRKGIWGLKLSVQLRSMPQNMTLKRFSEKRVF